MESWDARKNVIVCNIQKGMDIYECDVLLLRPTGYGVEFEIKLTRSDLMKDFKKEHEHDHELVKEVYFTVPMDLVSVALKEVPIKYGVIGVRRDKEMNPVTEIVRESQINPAARQWTDSERMQLLRLGNMRALKLKKELITCRRNTGK